jgi:peroxiredoxin
MIRLIEAGAPAPDFTLDGSDGRSHTLSRLLRESRVLLVFYPGNDTPG